MISTPYTTVTVSGYNASPPADDGSQTAANKVSWATVKTKLGDPLKTAIESINTNVADAINNKRYGGNIQTKAATFAVSSSDDGNVFLCGTGSYTVDLPAVGTVGEGFMVAIINTGSGTTVTVDGSGAETINGATTYVLGSQYQGVTLVTDGSAWYALEHAQPAASNSNVINMAQTGRVVTPSGLAALFAKGSTITATGAMVIPDGGYFSTQNTATIASLSTADDKSGRRVLMRFGAACTFAHDGTSMILPNAQTLSVTTNDIAEFVSEGSGNWRLVGLMKNNGDPFVKTYESGEQTVSAGALVTLTHGLGAMPRYVEVRLKCTGATGDALGYVQNDEVLHPMRTDSNVGTNVVMTATGVILVQGSTSPAHLINRSTFANGAITTAQWRWLVKASL